MKSSVARDSWHIEARKARKERGVTQQEMARRTGIHQSRLSQIENGEVDPKLSEVISVLESLSLKLVAIPSVFLESVEYTIRDCEILEERKNGPPTIPQMILGERASI